MSLASVSSDTEFEAGAARFVAWARGTAIPIDLSDPADAGVTQLSALWRDASAIGLGEATHGTSEFFTIKARLIEALALQGRLPALAFEAGVAESLALDAAVRGEIGAEEAVSGIRFWTWDTVEVQDMVKALCLAGRRHRPLPVFGVDPQFGASIARALVRRHGPDSGHPFPQHTRDLTDDFISDNFRTISASLADGVLDSGSAWTSLVRDSGDDPTDLRLAAALDAWLDMVPRAVADERRRVRDKAMCDAVLGMVETQAPVAVWAHNQHVAVDGFGGRLTSLGGHLRSALGSRYISVGLSFGSGGFQAIDETDTLRDHLLPSPPPMTWESLLDQVGPHVVAVPVHAAPDDVRAWLRLTRPASRGVGAGYAGEGHTWWRPDVDDFDWLVHVREAHPARRTPSGTRKPHPPVTTLSSPVDLDATTALDLGDHGWQLPSMRTRGHHVLELRDGAVIVKRDDPAHDFGYGLLVQEVDAAGLHGQWVEVEAEVTAPAPTIGCTVRALAESWIPEGERTTAVSDAHTVTGRTVLRTRLLVRATQTAFRYGVVVTGTAPVVVHTIRCRTIAER